MNRRSETLTVITTRVRPRFKTRNACFKSWPLRFENRTEQYRNS